MFKLNQSTCWFFIALLILSVGCQDDNDIRDVATVIELAQTAIHSSGSLDDLKRFSYDNTAQRGRRNDCHSVAALSYLFTDREFFEYILLWRDQFTNYQPKRYQRFY